MPFGEFIKVMTDILTKISTEFSLNERVFLNKPVIERKLWHESYEWANNKAIGRVKYADNKFFVQSSTNTTPSADFTLKSCEDLIYAKWKTFNQYKKNGFAKIYAVKMNMSKADWSTNPRCTCPHFWKKYTCKHVIGTALRFQLVKCPQNAIPTAIGKKPTRGRKKLASKALLRM